MTSWCPDMFEDSPKRNTKRLFLWASDEIAGSLRRKYWTEEYLARDYDYMAHMAWLIGSTSAAQALIRQVDVVTAAWGQGDEEKTLWLIKLCISHALSVWLGSVDRRPGLAGEARSTEYERAASSMLGTINGLAATAPPGTSTTTTHEVRAALAMDRQWTSEAEGERRPLVYACLILSRALEACGQRCIDWRKTSLPVSSVQAFLDTGALLETGLLGDSRRLQRVMDCLAEGAGSMKRFHRMNMEGKVLPS